ncbi:ribose 1,5-bisphosphokinase [Vibrio nigripulchritudo]|uniref:ribose 1,5-bisphosphokinase n=1 Tax=Vibrio nigripulchritudo TaxID=28173 RepID=UPI0005F9A90C|nr:ribose 1,5-bisphosphokinase [Vibrio nigripulchritudo]KJY70372.1 ribonucleoside-triphosphate reductase [Vibrio nigripulchritudo]
MATLFYVMGASGSGKDSVIQAIREDARLSVQVAHRYITRRADSGSENHVALTPEEFQQRVQSELFAMHWQANGLFYGVGKEIEHWLNQGQDVFLNGSRAYYPEALKRFATCIQPVWIDVNTHQLKQRLQARGRESKVEINARIDRAIQYQQKMPANALVIDNSDTLQSSVEQFILKFKHIKQWQKETRLCS